MSSSPRSRLTDEAALAPHRWWIATVTCGIAVPLWSLAIAGLQLGIAGQMIDGRTGRVADLWSASSIAGGIVCALLAWHSRHRVIRSGRWAGAAGALLLVGFVLLMSADAL